MSGRCSDSHRDNVSPDHHCNERAMSQFKGGDRVAFYSDLGRRVITLTSRTSDNYWRAKDANGFEITVHPKTIRRLKPKPERKGRRDWWIYESPLTKETIHNFLPMLGVMEEFGEAKKAWADSKKLLVTHVTELNPGDIIVSREELDYLGRFATKSLPHVITKLECIERLYRDDKETKYELLPALRELRDFLKALNLPSNDSGGKV